MTDILDAVELALRAASLLAGPRAGDPGTVRALAAPVIAWASQAGGDHGDIEVRCRALSVHHDNMRALHAGWDDLDGYTPEMFAAAADGYYRSLMGEEPPGPGTAPAAPPDTPGYARMHAGPDLTPRQLFALRNLLLAAVPPHPEGMPGGWRKLVADAAGYGHSAHPPVTAAEYAQIWAALFDGDISGMTAGPPGIHPDTTGHAPDTSPAGPDTAGARLADLDALEAGAPGPGEAGAPGEHPASRRHGVDAPAASGPGE